MASRDVAATTERLAGIVEAAERAAVAVIDDAEKEARRQLERAQAEADRIVGKRLESLARLNDSLVAQAESIRTESERLVAALEEARRRFDSDGGFDGDGEESAKLGRASHLTAVAPVDEATGDSTGERRTPAGARLLATQMAVSGSSREEIEGRLRSGFEIEDTEAILDAILGPED